MNAPKPNLAIYDFEGALEKAFQTALNGILGIPNAPTQGETKKLLSPRVEAKFVGGQNELHRYVVPNTNWDYCLLWSGILALKVVTERTKEQNISTHRMNVAAVRWLSQWPTEHISPNMPLHRLTQIIETGANPTIVTENNLDVTGMSFKIMINIRTAALPTQNV
jgi:hypothetical protein